MNQLANERKSKLRTRNGVQKTENGSEYTSDNVITCFAESEQRSESIPQDALVVSGQQGVLRLSEVFDTNSLKDTSARRRNSQCQIMFAISIGFRNGLSRLAVLPNLFKDDFIDVTPRC